MRRVLAAVIALFNLANGMLMLVDPAAWFQRIPGVPATGPFNPHFVLDVGLAFLAAGAAFAALAMTLKAWPAAMAGAGFLALHGLLHLWNMVQGHNHVILFDLVLVVLPAALAVAVAWPNQEMRSA